MDYIRITEDNIDGEHICCAMSGKIIPAAKPRSTSTPNAAAVFKNFRLMRSRESVGQSSKIMPAWRYRP